MCEMALLDSILNECEKRGIGFKLEYWATSEPGYNVTVGGIGLTELVPSRYAASMEALALLKTLNHPLFAEVGE